jgi:hypothetical protein
MKNNRNAFVRRSGETILARYDSRPAWYAIAWKCLSGLVIIILPSAAAFLLFYALLWGWLIGFLSEGFASFIAGFLFFAIVPLLLTAWVVEDLVRFLTGGYVLTDQRFWVKASPWAWSQEEIPLEDIKAMVHRHEAVFIRRRSKKNPQVCMLAGGKELVRVFNEQVSARKTPG